MSLKYVLSSMKRHILRTLVVCVALIVGVALVGALLGLVDTERQFSLQSIGLQTGGYDLSITRADTSLNAFFDVAPVEQTVRNVYPEVSAIYPRIQGDTEARMNNSVQGTGTTMVALNADVDKLIRVTISSGDYPPNRGQVFLSQAAADLLKAQVGDEVNLSYIRPTPRQVGKAASSNDSTSRSDATFTVAGIGLISGLGDDVSNAVLVRLDDAQLWLGTPNQAERVLVVWNSDTAAGNDAKVAVSHARDAGQDIKEAVQTQLGTDYTVELPKYKRLDQSAQGFIFEQIFITLYGLLSMGIVGLMVNALMITTVTEQKHDLAVLRVIGAPRRHLFQTVVLEVAILGAIGVVLGLLLGRFISDNLIAPLLLANLELPPGVHTEWTLESVLTPTLITTLVLAIATISPARMAGATKVMVVLNPAAADQPTLEDLSKLRERRADYRLLIVGIVLLAFCGVILGVFMLVASLRDMSIISIVLFAALLLMVIGMSLVFYFVTTPLERILIGLFSLVNPHTTYFTGRYAMRGKGRNSLISLMVVASAVLPCLLGTELALTDANIETDLRFSRGAAAQAQLMGQGNVRFFNAASNTETNLSPQDIADLGSQPGITAAVGVAESYNTEVSDRVQLRSVRANAIGVGGDLNGVLYPEFMQWTQGDASSLARIVNDPDAVIISGGLSEQLDLNKGDIMRVKGEGYDHERMLTIIGVATRLPGFGGITRNSGTAQSGSTSILMNIETYRNLRHDPDTGAVDEDEALYTRALLNTTPGVNIAELSKVMRDTFSQERNISISFTSEVLDMYRTQLSQSRIFSVVLAGLSMITAVFGVLAVMYTAVMSRRVEIAMLKALGAPGRRLRSIFVGEAVITTLAAALAGIIAGTLLGYAFEFSIRVMQESPMLLAFDSTTAIIVVVMVCLAAIFSALMATQPVLRQKAVMILREH
jgi:putative ABC transport system permease protein